MSDSIDKRAAELRQSIARSQADLDVAMAQLKRTSTGFGLGHFMAADPWHWLLFAGVAGALIGLHQGESPPWKK
jgi:hypothetical protein